METQTNKMRTASHFLSFLYFILLINSSSTSQSDEKKSYEIITTEIVKIKEEFRHLLSDQVNQLKSDWGLNRDQLVNQLSMELKQSKRREEDLQNEINDIKQELEDLNAKREQEAAGTKSQNRELEQLKSEKNSLKKEMNDMKVKLEEEVSDTEAHKKECARREEAIKSVFEEGQSERVGLLEKSVSQTIPHVHLRSSYEYYKTESDFTWTINDIREKAKEANFTLLSEVFPLKGYSFGARAMLTLDEDNYLQISLAYKDLNESGTALDLKIIPGVRYTYKERPSKNIFRERNHAFATVLPNDSFSYDAWILPANNIADDTISIDIQVESPEAVQQGYSYNGVLTWAIDNFRSKRKMEVQQFVWRLASPYFYTGPKGYKVRARLWLDGLGEYNGKGLTVSIDFLTCPYDADLSRSFKHKTTFTLFHPTDPAKVIVKSVERDLKDNVFYTIGMGTHAEIENVLDGDTLYYQVKIIPV